MSVLVYVENAEGNFKKSTYEVVSYAKALADLLNTDLIAISIGEVAQDQLGKLGKYGASKVINVKSDILKTFVIQAYASAISEAAKKESADVLILANSFSGKGLAPRVAVKLQAALVDSAVELPQIENNSFTVKKTAFSGKAFATVELHSAIKVIAVNPNSFQVTENSGTANIEDFQPEIKDSDVRITVTDVVRATDKIALPDAELVVSAGRGLKGPENWSMIEELADVLGAATACSKPVSDAGWRPHEEHVGQTGIAVSPNLYIAIGISGAIQHLAGVSSSKTIVVINKDPEAPFFKVADYGIVGDAFEVVPKLTEALKAYKSHS
ncbi:MAG: electron transfer flavoprotein subunit alpha/FixB family protein [Daejeonella sp.]|uniref:electron transfer flavoprotein subunit alpha/FixB family protein n=1 Tax=Daejeonella sp. TaxID=2805397 RepID=UPI003C71E309